MLSQVGLAEIERIFEVTDGLGIHRESLVIPLRPGRPGRIRRRSDGKIEIVMDAEADFEAWLGALPAALAALPGG